MDHQAALTLTVHPWHTQGDVQRPSLNLASYESLPPNMRRQADACLCYITATTATMLSNLCTDTYIYNSHQFGPANRQSVLEPVPAIIGKPAVTVNSIMLDKSCR